MTTTTTNTATGTFEGKTATEWRAESAAANARRNESYDRCDTDGFVSQWAHSMTEGENNLKAQLAEQNGMTEVRALFDLDGNLVSTLHGWSEYGEYFRITTTGKFFNPSQARNETTATKNNAKKGFYIGTVRVQATAKIVGGGKGLAGAASCYPMIVPVSNEITPDTCEIVDNGK